MVSDHVTCYIQRQIISALLCVIIFWPVISSKKTTIIIIHTFFSNFIEPVPLFSPFFKNLKNFHVKFNHFFEPGT